MDVFNANRYCDAMADRELRLHQIPQAVSESGNKKQLVFVINFDDQIFVNGWHDNIEIEDYAPRDWIRIEGNPLDYVPPEIRQLWLPSTE